MALPEWGAPAFYPAFMDAFTLEASGGGDTKAVPSARLQLLASVMAPFIFLPDDIVRSVTS